MLTKNESAPHLSLSTEPGTHHDSARPPHTRTAARRSLQLRRLSAIFASACALAPTHAFADEGVRWSGGGGFNLGVAFTENSKPRFTLGFEAFAVRRMTAPEYGDYYSDESLEAVGPLLQFNVIPGDGWRGTFGATAGWSPGNAQHALMGELGATYRFKHKDWGLRVGALYEPTIATLAARHDFFINETSLTGGFRMPGTFGAPLSNYFTGSFGVMDGRPLRTESNAKRRSARRLPESLSAQWARRAQDEFEAIFAFGSLSLELMAAEAPDILIEKALASAEQEISHAQICATEARKFDDSFRLQRPQDCIRQPLPGVAGLSRLALEGLKDGYEGEGLAAETMRASARHTRDATLSQKLSRVSTEEVQHSRLGAAIATWALEADATGIVRDAVMATKHAHFQNPVDDFSEPQQGFISLTQKKELAERAREGLHLRIDKMLAV